VQQLGVVDVCDLLDRLDLENQLARHDEIQLLFAQPLSAIVNGKGLFAFEGNVVGAQFDCQRT
jgi:hypothetical protein